MANGGKLVVRIRLELVVDRLRGRPEGKGTGFGLGLDGN